MVYGENQRDRDHRGLDHRGLIHYGLKGHEDQNNRHIVDMFGIGHKKKRRF